MFSFSGSKKTVPVTIDGKTYDLPRFGVDQFAEWAEQRREANTQRALSEAGVTDKESRARFRAYFTPPVADYGEQLREVSQTSIGAAYVIRHCMKRAGVPADQIEAVLEADLPDLVELAQALTLAKPAATAVDGMVAESDEASADPLSDPNGGSDGSPSTGKDSTPDSSTPTGLSMSAA